MERKDRFSLLVLVLFSLPCLNYARSWTDIVSKSEMLSQDESMDMYGVEIDPLPVFDDIPGFNIPGQVPPVSKKEPENVLTPGTISWRPYKPKTPAPTSAPTMAPVTRRATPSPTTKRPSFSVLIFPDTAAPQYPSQVPTPTKSQPTVYETEEPTLPPTHRPIRENTLPPRPTPSPTIDPYPENPPPSDPSPSYFNYDTKRTALYGPGYPELFRVNATTIAVGYKNNGWATRDVPEDYYWNEFDLDGYGPWKGTLASRRIERNMCDRIGKQSPIDVRESGAACEEHHEVRSRPGDFRVSGDEVEKRIESNKLRLVYKRRPCANITHPDCSEPDPPHADFPNNWGGFADLMHVDFKIPSEHLIEGLRYDGEMQIYHLHPGRRRTPTVASLMNATEMGHNIYLQVVLDSFEYTYHSNRAKCAKKIRRERKLLSEAHKILGKNIQSDYTDYTSLTHFSTDLDDPKFIKRARHLERKLQSGVWDPHHPDIVPSIHFFGYDGSLTEPPCSEFVSWFVCDKPMTISMSQLEQMKRLLFTNIDPDCNPTSVHFKESVARPIQDTAGRSVWRCDAEDFGPDP